jgi:hypothetical protein
VDHDRTATCNQPPAGSRPREGADATFQPAARQLATDPLAHICPLGTITLDEPIDS